MIPGQVDNAKAALANDPGDFELTDAAAEGQRPVVPLLLGDSGSITGIRPCTGMDLGYFFRIRHK